MLVRLSSQPGATAVPNEDWAWADESIIVVLDGGTARTETGCVHGVPWYAARLGESIVEATARTGLRAVLAHAIRSVAERHGSCDLSHPATPSAAAAIVTRTGDDLEYLVLGDITIVAETDEGISVVVDERVDATARPERDEADRHPYGSPEKQAALLTMKHAELAARNSSGGYWVAAQDDRVVGEALAGRWHGVRRLAVLTDGAARIVRMFGELGWQQVLDHDPASLIERVRELESTDPDCRRWPRNKRHDDATVAIATACGQNDHRGG
jgi:hypothetical protein